MTLLAIHVFTFMMAFYHEVVKALLFRFSGCDKEMNTFGSTKVSILSSIVFQFKILNIIMIIYYNIFVYYIRDVWLSKK